MSFNRMKKRLLSACLALCVALTLIPVSAQAASVTGRANETAVYDYLVNTMGLNAAAACGVMACISVESSFSPTAGGSYYGLCQWDGSRKTRLMNYCSANGYDYTTLDGQLHFLEYDLNSTYSSVGSYLRGVSNDTAGAYKAGYYFCYYYLIPGSRNTASISRGKLAMNTYCPVYGVAVDTDPCAGGHTLVTKNAKTATCTSEGYTGDKVCAVCGETVETGSAIAVAAHTAITVNAAAATCTAEGYTGDTVCSVCGVTLSTGEAIEIANHQTELVNQSEADWIREGYTGDEVCTVCGQTIAEGESVPAVGNGQDITLFVGAGQGLETLTAAEIARLLLSAGGSQLVLNLQGCAWTPEALTEALEQAEI